MTRRYTLAIIGKPGNYSACVPELPSIVITGGSLSEIDTRAHEAIRKYLDEVQGSSSVTAIFREIEVEVPS